MGTGCVVVREGRVVSRERNEATALADVTAHAETQAMRRLALDWRVINPSVRAESWRLRCATLYTTVELRSSRAPCAPGPSA